MAYANSCLTKLHMHTVQTTILNEQSLSDLHCICTARHFTQYCKKQLHKKQNLDQKLWNKVFKILGHLPLFLCRVLNFVHSKRKIVYSNKMFYSSTVKQSLSTLASVVFPVLRWYFCCSFFSSVGSVFRLTAIL